MSNWQDSRSKLTAETQRGLNNALHESPQTSDFPALQHYHTSHAVRLFFIFCQNIDRENVCGAELQCACKSVVSATSSMVLHLCLSPSLHRPWLWSHRQGGAPQSREASSRANGMQHCVCVCVCVCVLASLRQSSTMKPLQTCLRSAAATSLVFM